MTRKKDFKVGMIFQITNPFPQINHFRNKIGKIELIKREGKYPLEIKFLKKKI